MDALYVQSSYWSTNKETLIEYVGQGPKHLLTVTDFESIITNLETVGGMPHEILPIEDPTFSSGRIVKGETG
jgi:hypothetical protein